MSTSFIEYINKCIDHNFPDSLTRNHFREFAKSHNPYQVLDLLIVRKYSIIDTEGEFGPEPTEVTFYRRNKAASVKIDFAAEVGSPYNISSLISLVNSHTSKINKLKQDVAKEEEDINKLKEDVDKAEEDIAALRVTVGEHTTKIGSPPSLTTTAKSNLVVAINEIDGHCDTNTLAIGTLGTLATTAKANLVVALNEVKIRVDANTLALGDLSALITIDQGNIVSAINELTTHLSAVSDALQVNISRQKHAIVIGMCGSSVAPLFLLDLKSILGLTLLSPTFSDSCIKMGLEALAGVYTYTCTAASFTNLIGSVLAGAANTYLESDAAFALC